MKKYLFDILYYSQVLRLFKQFYFHYEVKKYIGKDDVVIDIGANWGCYTRLFSRWASRVFAVEPLTAKQSTEEVIWLPFALGGENKTVRFNQWRDSDGAWTIQFDENGEYQYTSSMKKGSEIFESLYKINFIKIDVEGSELPIIEDMKELIKKHKPMILIETGKIDEVLSILGYGIKDQSLNDYLICLK